MSQVGLTALGAYVPYYFIDRKVFGEAWGARGMKGQKSLANVDEDSITMAVEAAQESFRLIDRENIDSVYFASTTAPYAEKSHATLINTALDLKANTYTSDFASSQRAGVSALRSAFSDVKAGLVNNALITASDTRDGYPKSPQEQMFGDAAASFVVGKENVFATIDDFYSTQNEINDLWRNIDDQYVRNAEGRFARDEGFMRSMTTVIDGILEKTSLTISDFSKIVIAAPENRYDTRIAKAYKISQEQLAENYFDTIGITGVAQPLLSLVGVLEEVDPGDKILVLAYGNGADAVVLTVTEEIKRVKELNSISKYLEKRQEFSDYGRFLSFREIIEAQPGEDYKIPGSTSQTWREQETYYRLYASKCNECGQTAFPAQRICSNCRSVDNYEKVRLSDKTAKLFTYSIDHLAGRSDDPMIIQAVNETEDGTRVYMNITDFDEKEVAIDMDVEFTFRKIHNLANFVNYYWKVRPIRRKRV